MFWQLSWPEFWFVLYRYNQSIWEQLRSKDLNVPLKADEYLSLHFKKGNFRIKFILVPCNFVTCWNVPHVDPSYTFLKSVKKNNRNKTKHLTQYRLVLFGHNYCLSWAHIHICIRDMLMLAPDTIEVVFKVGLKSQVMIKLSIIQINQSQDPIFILHACSYLNKWTNGTVLFNRGGGGGPKKCFETQ